MGPAVDPPRLGVSVVVPVYNGGERLVHCLDSLAAQDLPQERFEVIAVDDGSTDGSAEELDAFAATHPNVRVIHQERSGSPGRPRNRGTDMAGGEFVFYLDADDGLAPNALSRMLDFARQHASDVVIVGRTITEGDEVIKPLDRRIVVANARLREIFKMLTAHKLIRRERVAQNGVRFPEGRVIWEDGIFLARLAPYVQRVSVLADEAYYRKVRTPDRLSRSATAVGRAQAVMNIVETLRTHGVDAHETEIIAFRLYRRLMRKWSGPHFLRLRPEERELLVSTMHEAATTVIPPERHVELPYRVHLRSLAFRHGRTPQVVALVESEQDPRLTALLRRPQLWPLVVRAWIARAPRKASQARRSARKPRPRG